MNTQKPSILLSIKPVYAHLILSGKKTIELRKSFTKDAENSRMYLYATTPVKKIIGAVDVKSVLNVLVDEIDANIVLRACVDENMMHDYYKNNKTATLLELENPVTFEQTVDLSEMRALKHSPHNSHKKLQPDDKLANKLLEIYKMSCIML